MKCIVLLPTSRIETRDNLGSSSTLRLSSAELMPLPSTMPIYSAPTVMKFRKRTLGKLEVRNRSLS